MFSINATTFGQKQDRLHIRVKFGGEERKYRVSKSKDGNLWELRQLIKAKEDKENPSFATFAGYNHLKDVAGMAIRYIIASEWRGQCYQ